MNDRADRFELLAAVGEVADGTLSLEETTERLLDIVVPAFADLALLDAISSPGEIRRLGARVEAPQRAEAERALLRRRRVAAAPVGVAAAITSGKSELLSPITDAHLRALASSEEDLALLGSLAMRAAMFVPLRARGRVLGALACGVGSSGRDYGEDDLRFAEVLAGRFALALDNAGLSAAVSGLEQQFEATLANLAEAVIVRDAGGRMIFANAAAARLLGLGSVEQVTGAGAEALMALYDVYDETGRPITLADLPTAVAERGEYAEPLLVRNVIRATGDERWLLHKATPVFHDDGALSLIVSVIENVTEVKRAELAQRLLAQAGKELSSSLDYEQTLQRVAQLAVPELADWCGVVIRGEGDVLEQVAVAHSDPERVEVARRFGERYPARMTDPTGTPEVVRSGKSQLIPQITEEMLVAAEITDEQLDLIRELQMRSVIIVPLEIAGRAPIGALSLVMADSGRVFDEDDLTLAEELARRAATAVENSRLYTESVHIADTLQQSLLPPVLPRIHGFSLASLYRAAGEQNEVGGDFYDAFEVAGGWLVVVGDVAGRGAEAAALTSLSRHTLRTAAKLLGDPIAALGQLNAALRERPRLSLVSVCCALLRPADGRVGATVVLAGHPPAYLVRGGEPQAVGIFAPFLGVDDTGAWQGVELALEVGDRLVLYTDGVIDTVGASERFGEERLERALRGTGDAAETVRRIEEAVSAFASGPQVDDTAVLVVERVSSDREWDRGEPDRLGSAREVEARIG